MKKNENKKEIFEKMPAVQAVLTLAVPTIISQMINVIYNIADTFFVGRTGNPYMIAGVSLCLPLFILTIAFSNLFGIGGGSLISRLIGAGRDEEGKAVCSFSFYASLALAVIYSLILFLFADPILRAMGASDATIGYSYQYLLLVSVFGSIPTILSAVVAHLLRSTGYSAQASFGLSGGGILNILLDPLFMFVLFPKGKEVLAAGAATLLSNTLAFLYLTLVLIQVSSRTSLSVKPSLVFSVSKEKVKEIISVGFPSAILPGLFDLANIFLNMSMSVYGDLQLAALGIVMKLERIPIAIGMGISQGMLPLVAYNYSSGNHDRMREVIRKARRIGIVSALLCVLIYQIFAKQMVGIFINSSASQDIATALLTVSFATAFLRLRSLAAPFQFINYHSSYCMQAMGDGKGTLIHTIIRVVVVYIPVICLMDRLFGQNGLAGALAVSEAITDIAALYLLNRKKK